MSSLFAYPRLQDPDDLRDPSELRMRLTALKVRRDVLAEGLRNVERQLEEVRSKLALAPEVEQALQILSEKIFLDLVSTLQEKLTIALQEVLEQPLVLRAESSYKRGSATVDFYIERGGNREEIMSGQGGSVVNVLSVGLRMFALTTLDESEHRRFLVLDEPDGWLRPELVPRLVKIIHDAGKALGFQVILISHHDVEVFRDYADKIYAFTPQPDGSVKVACVSDAKSEPSVD
jgi:ABC-type glutathione transport system ATPase component